MGSTLILCYLSYDRVTDRHKRKFTQASRGGRDGRREPDSSLGYTQDYRSQWRTADEERGAEGRPAVDQIPEITGICIDSQWDFPRRRTLFTSDGTNSRTSKSDTPEGCADRPPEVEYLER